jgi:hypothetical protein
MFAHYISSNLMSNGRATDIGIRYVKLVKQKPPVRQANASIFPIINDENRPIMVKIRVGLK